MSHYHVYQCDRCGDPVKGGCNGKPPQYWSELMVLRTSGRDSYQETRWILCGSCFSLVESLIRNKTMQLIDTATHYRARLEEIHEPSDS